MGKKTKTKATIVRGEDDMLKKIRACVTLAEYRDKVLGEGLKDCAKRAGVSIVQAHRIERGNLPKKFRLLEKYFFGWRCERYPDEFIRLAKGGAA